MKYRLFEIKVPVEYTAEEVTAAAAARTKLPQTALSSCRIVRRSIDARHGLQYNLTVEIETDAELKEDQKAGIRPYTEELFEPEVGDVSSYDGPRPVVVGAGPAGLMAALVLARANARPIIIERGEATVARSLAVEAFNQSGELDPDSNVLYGEGGAGLFSDGKLTARSKDRAGIGYFFNTLIECGADPEIMVDAEPHLGTDVLQKVMPALRQKIEAAGGEFQFSSCLEGLSFDAALTAVTVNGSLLETRHCILAVGHSARDVYRMLADQSVVIEPKPFAIGARVEVPQDGINVSQYGDAAGHPQLGAAGFRLTRKPGEMTRACYSFCMCPGGEVMTCASAPGLVTSNGMSSSQRDGVMGNAGFLVPVEAEEVWEYADKHYPKFGGIMLQEEIEARAFERGGEDYSLPASKLADFLEGRESTSLPSESSCARAVAASLDDLAPDYIMDTLRHAIPGMLAKLGGIDFHEAVIYGMETRSSSPVRIARDQMTREALRRPGLFPCGEGAGYAGGIVSSALDGIRTAEAVLMNMNTK